MRGELGIDKNINEATIDQYLNRDDAVYRDMRMLVDEADYEAIGGDSYLSGYVEGFEIVPYPYLCNVTGLPEAVGNTYTGATLFTQNEDGTYTANYEESMQILEDLFPKDKTIFLMCGGGGYAGMTKKLLAGSGWNEEKIYDAGGFWYYKGKHAVSLKREENGRTYYDFHKAPYHLIDFSVLHPLEGYEPEQPVQSTEKESTSETSSLIQQLKDEAEMQQKIDSGEAFALYVYLPGCTSCASFRPVLDEFISGSDITIYQISYTALEGKDNAVTERVSYTPSVLIFENGEVKGFLDPASDADLTYYKTSAAFSEWISQYLDTDTVNGNIENTAEPCESSCSVLGG